jgi:hypothetical protein
MAARTTTKPEETETPEPEKVDHASLIDAVREVLAEIGVTGTPSEEPEESTTPEEEEVETPRQTETRMRRAVEQAVGSLHIHVGDSAGKKEEPATKEPEQVPGGPGKLAKWIGLAP